MSSSASAFATTRELIAYLRAAEPEEQAEILDDLEAEEIAPGVTALDALAYDWSAYARPEQLAPELGVRWRFLFQRAGRGGGKTRGAAELTREAAEDFDGCGGKIALIAPTYGDIRITMVEGESGILAVCPPWNRPKWEPGIGHGGRLTWPNGVQGFCFSAEKPDRVRGPQFGFVWGDEIAAWGDKGTVIHDLLNPAMRLGKMPRCVYTSTPKPTPFVEMLDAEAEREEREILEGKRSMNCRTYVQRVWSTFDNADNLPPETLAELRRRYGGTSQGRQELEAELIRDDPDAMWSQSMIDHGRVGVDDVPELVRIAIGVDNATTKTKPGIIDDATIQGRNRAVGSADTGIVGVGLGSDGHFYVLDDWTLNAGPAKWGTRICQAFANAWQGQRADIVFVEVNGGGDLIKRNIDVVLRDKGIDPALVPCRYVNATEGKEARADPIVALYEQRRVHHVHRPITAPGAIAPLVDLEYQMTRFKRGRTGYKKDRVDALVWAITGLLSRPAGGRAKRARARARAYVA